MTESDFFASPQPLGRPLPLDEHAVSVSLPTWADVVGYEEGDKRVTDLMKIGYPRFKVHACIERLIELTKQKHHIEASQECMILPTQHVANSFINFLNDGGCSEGVSLIGIGYLGVHAVAYPAEYKAQGRKFWQHTGEIVSSRLIEDALRSIESNASKVDWAVTTAHNPSGVRLSASDAHMLKFRQGLDLDFSSTQTVAEFEDSQVECVSGVIKERIACIVHEPAEQVTLCVSGMAAIFGALKSAQELDRQNNCIPGKIVVFGFPYLDTLKLMQLKEFNPAGCTFMGTGEGQDLDLLEASLNLHRSQHHTAEAEGAGTGPPGGVSAVFTEFPSNPLLKCPDLHRLTNLAREFNFLLVVDDTIGNFFNLDLLQSKGVRADIICSSLTKIFSGRGDVLAGSIVLNSHSVPFDSPSASASDSASSAVLTSRAAARAVQLKSIIKGLNLPSLYIADAVTLEANSRDFVSRCKLVSSNGKALADWLRVHPSVKALHYSTGEEYESVMRLVPGTDRRSEDAGYGCLMSIVPVDSIDEKAFYDALEVAKGPSLGTNFTIACPYTLLAHYTELPWAAGFGVDSRLIRVSVGMEDIEHLKGVFSRALAAAMPQISVPAKL